MSAHSRGACLKKPHIKAFPQVKSAEVREPQAYRGLRQFPCGLSDLHLTGTKILHRTGLAGTQTGYKADRCRCPQCTAWNTGRGRKERGGMSRPAPVQRAASAAARSAAPRPSARNTIAPAARTPQPAPPAVVRATAPAPAPAAPRPSQRPGPRSTPASIMAQQQRAQTGVIWERGASPYRRPATSAPTAAPAQAAPPPPETPVRSPWAKLKPGRLRDTLEAATGPL